MAERTGTQELRWLEIELATWMVRILMASMIEKLEVLCWSEVMKD